MWFSETKTLNRRGFLGLAGAGAALAALSGCGFSPAYGEGGTGQALRNTVRAADPVTRSDYQFLHALEDVLGRPTAPRFDLAYTITTRQVDGGLVENFGATRIQLFGTLGYVLTDTTTGLTVSEGELAGNTVYSTTGTQLSTFTAAEDAELRLMRMLADSLVTRLYTEPGIPTA